MVLVEHPSKWYECSTRSLVGGLGRSNFLIVIYGLHFIKGIFFYFTNPKYVIGNRSLSLTIYFQRK